MALHVINDTMSQQIQNKSLNGSDFQVLHEEGIYKNSSKKYLSLIIIDEYISQIHYTMFLLVLLFYCQYFMAALV